VAAIDKVNGMSQEPKSFTVSDRRHFTSEGEPREDSEAPSAPPGAAPKPQEPAAKPSVAPSVEFGPFILSLAAQAGQLLAAEGDASGLEDARHLIAIIEMLKDKTEGRRSGNEDQILETVLYELRMGYVARTRTGGA
jgi:Domain of unknown function (DUF1844)